MLYADSASPEKINKDITRILTKHKTTSSHQFDLWNSKVADTSLLRPLFFYFLFLRFFPQKVRVGGGNKIKNKITVNNLS